MTELDYAILAVLKQWAESGHWEDFRWKAVIARLEKAWMEEKRVASEVKS